MRFLVHDDIFFLAVVVIFEPDITVVAKYIYLPLFTHNNIKFKNTHKPPETTDRQIRHIAKATMNINDTLNLDKVRNTITE